MLAVTLNIDSRGQIRLPKKMRAMFDQSVVLRVVDYEHIIISPILDLAGSLSNYNDLTKATWEDTRQKAWEKSTEGRG